MVKNGYFYEDQMKRYYIDSTKYLERFCFNLFFINCKYYLNKKYKYNNKK